ncbi:BgTH12-03818 [Blumeria graminis f. sp. triticale]|uniref:BgTH12-03818 n=1 Tax=Blumeria graminis f. sp. triticale TaxID=1689686 RepID=A0A9W4D1Q7_BLUGR|nr:BgTH12-03818 [Blumeria graminis f. sp. triticale]
MPYPHHDRTFYSGLPVRKGSVFARGRDRAHQRQPIRSSILVVNVEATSSFTK